MAGVVLELLCGYTRGDLGESCARGSLLLEFARVVRKLFCSNLCGNYFEFLLQLR